MSGYIRVGGVDTQHDLLLDISRTGKHIDHDARVYHVMGRRAGFNSITVLQDVKEYNAAGAGATDAIVDMVGTEPLELVSSSASDAAAGTGARTVSVTYIDATTGLIATSQDFVLNGTGNVSMGAIRAKAILYAEAITAGSAGVSVGNIQVRNSTDHTTVYEQITAGGNVSLSGYFMIPIGHSGYLYYWDAGCVGTADQDARLRATLRKSDQSLISVYHYIDQSYLASPGGRADESVPYFKLPAGCRVKVSTFPTGTGSSNRIDCSFSILIMSDG